MPNYTSNQLAVLMSVPALLQQFPELQARSSENSGYGYIQQIKDYMLNHTDDDDYDITQIIAFKSPRVYTGNGGMMRVPDLTQPGFRMLPGYFSKCGDQIQDMLKDTQLMQREPMLHAYLRYADTVLQSPKSDSMDRNGYCSDIAYNIANTLFETFTHIPTGQEMDSLRMNNPGAYVTGMKIMAYLNAFATYNAMEMLKAPDQGDAEATKAFEEERMRRLNRLIQAADEFSSISLEDVKDFYNAIQPDTRFDELRRTVYDRPEKNGHQAAFTHLSNQKRLMEQGLSREEARTLWDTLVVLKSINSEMDSIGNDLRNLNEPFLSKMNRLNELGAVCQEKYANGFASMEEKNQLFLQLGTAFKEFSDLVRTHSPQNLPENATEKERVRYATTQMLVQTCLNEATLPESIFRRAVDMKDRIIAVENTKSWQNRSDITPDFAVLKSTKLNYLGAREGAQYKDYKAMMDALSVVTKNFGRTKQNSTQRLQLGESSRLAMEKGESYLNSVIEHSAPNELSNNPSKQASATRLRVIGVLGILHTLNPEKAEQMLEKTKVLFGHKLNWDEVSTMAKQAYNRNPNFARYFELHSGDAIDAIPDRKLAEYAAKASAALYYMDIPNKKFSLSVPRNHAKSLMSFPSFQAAMRAAGPERIRQVLKSGDPVQIVQLTAGTQARYALNDQTKQSLRDLAETMNHDRPSKEWTELKAALNDRDAVNSRNVFLAAENYLKGREGVSSDPKRRIGFSAALKAVALAAENGDAVAKERAKILVEHINTVRKTRPGQPNYVDLKDYAPKKSAAPEHQAMPEV